MHSAYTHFDDSANQIKNNQKIFSKNHAHAIKKTSNGNFRTLGINFLKKAYWTAPMDAYSYSYS